MTSQNLIAVDGGGTRCRIVLIHKGQRHQLNVGSANVYSDFDGALRTIRNGLQSVAHLVGLSFDQIAHYPVHLGLAGVLDVEIGQRVSQSLAFTNATVTDDRITTLAGALGHSDGCVAGIGTGSFFARQCGQKSKLIGGYGLQLGDDASGAWLGVKLLQYCLLVLDGFYPRSPLSDRVWDEFSNAPKRMISFAKVATASQFGAFSPRIFAAAQGGDKTGLALVQMGAKSITSACTALGRTQDEPLVLMGGVGPHYTPFLPSEISAQCIDPKGSALDGAIYLATQHALAQAKDGTSNEL